MRSVKIRLSEVAARAGVSVSTVSRVLNDKAGVQESVRRSVLTAVDVLGYERPAALRHRAAGLVGLLLPELDNPIFPRFAEAIEVELKHASYTPVLCSQSLGGVHEDTYVEALLERGVAGMVFVSGQHANLQTDPARYHRLLEHKMPIVLVNGFVEGLPASFVSNDDLWTSELAVAHLAQMGHTRIGLAIGQQRYVPAVRRVAGFADAMRRHVDAALTDDELATLVEHTFYGVEGGQLAAAHLLDRDVTAIVCGSDLMALGAIREAHQRGLRVPADVSVVGSDDSALLEFTEPPLTTVRQPVAAMSSTAVRRLVDLIHGVEVPQGEMVFRPELVVRGSTARARS